MQKNLIRYPCNFVKFFINSINLKIIKALEDFKKFYLVLFLR